MASSTTKSLQHWVTPERKEYISTEERKKRQSIAFEIVKNQLKSNEEMMEFENRMREIIADLTKPIYSK